MFKEDLVLSDVHLEKVTTDDNAIIFRCTKLGENRIYFSNFKITCPEELKNELKRRTCHDFSSSTNREGLFCDEDGDLVVTRERNTIFDGEHISLKIFHSMASSLDAVGLQVWRGALLMNDYILNNIETFKNKSILELGGGVGFTSLIAGIISDKIVLTDVGGSTMDICHKNLDQNFSILCDPLNFRIRELDWFKGKESITKLELEKPDIILACDVIYDNNITDAFFQTLNTLFRGDVYAGEVDKAKAIIVLISIEKRLNFTLEDLEVTCKEYDYFRECLRHLNDKTNNFVEVEKVDTEDIPLFFAYDRTPQLEMWKIECKQSLA